MELVDIASEIDFSACVMDRISDLIGIVLTEVFDKCRGSEGNYLGKLFPYEHSFESVLISAADLVLEQQNQLDKMSKQLHELSKSDKQPA